MHEYVFILDLNSYNNSQMKNSEQLKGLNPNPTLNQKLKEAEMENFQESENQQSSNEDTQISNKEKSNIKKKNKQKKLICNVADTKYPVVRYVCKKMLKFKLQRNMQGVGWDLMWTDNAVQPQQLSKMLQHQKINHFPGMFSLSRKNYLGRNLMKMRKKFPQQYKFFPITWMLPSQYGEFKAYYQKNKKCRTFIVKPQASCQGRGIFLTRDIQDIQHGEHYVVQKYITKPFLIQNLKFDFRIYVLLAGCSPLRIYLYNQGLTRFATEKYIQPNKDNMQKVCMHLTNYAINKSNQNFIYNQSQTEMNTGHKRSLTAVLTLLQQQGHDVKSLWNKIKDLLIKTFISAQPVLSHHYKSCQPSNYANNMCFELLGFDIMLDDKFNPNLLQVNYTPSFSTDTPLDKLIKKNVICDSIKLMNINNKAKNQIIETNKQILNKRVLSGKKVVLTNEEKLQEIRKAQLKRDEWENKHLGGYQKIYPCENSKQYDEYLAYAQQCYQSLTGANIRRNVKKEKSVQLTEIKKQKQTTNQELQKIYKQRLPIPKNNISRKNNVSTVKPVTGIEGADRLQTNQTNTKVEVIDISKQIQKQKNETFYGTKKILNKNLSSDKQINSVKIAKQKDLGNYVRPKLFQLNNIPKNNRQ